MALVPSARPGIPIHEGIEQASGRLQMKGRQGTARQAVEQGAQEFRLLLSSLDSRRRDLFEQGVPGQRRPCGIHHHGQVLAGATVFQHQGQMAGRLGQMRQYRLPCCRVTDFDKAGHQQGKGRAALAPARLSDHRT